MKIKHIAYQFFVASVCETELEGFNWTFENNRVILVFFPMSYFN
jgi:hypothetical protein